MDMNDQAKVSIKFEQPKIPVEESLEVIKEAFQLLSYAQYEGSCESDYNNLLNEYGMSSDDYPMPAFAFEYFECIFSGSKQYFRLTLLFRPAERHIGKRRYPYHALARQFQAPNFF